ncbi:toll/interleukin-1 receptor domain-containing protein [bacterium]|nr:toll/interleukin-1 receptor domain-containing protein [bacterium]
MYFTKSRLKSAGYTYNYSSVRNSINENTDSFNIFLSHSYADKEYILELKRILENYGYSVYVDWITDGKTLSRDNVSKDTAKLIRKRMRQSKSMIFATSSNSPNSKWMPWELGCFDGLKNSKIAILPITNSENDSFIGQEYLRLYPYITEEGIKDKNSKTLWINETSTKYVSFNGWLYENKEPYAH